MQPKNINFIFNQESKLDGESNRVEINQVALQDKLTGRVADNQKSMPYLRPRIDIDKNSMQNLGPKRALSPADMIHGMKQL